MDCRRGEHLSNGGRRSAAERQLPQEANYPDATPRIHIALAALLPLFGTCALDLLSFFVNPCLPKSKHPRKTSKMTALFNFQSLLLVILLLVCTSTYLHAVAPGLLDRNKDGGVSEREEAAKQARRHALTRHSVFGIFWKFARVGERLSPYVSLCCVLMAVRAPSLPLFLTTDRRLTRRTSRLRSSWARKRFELRHT
ncbi:hypothetical protein IWZ01DRAFT_115272 [Phyllosticta capitalensis]